MWATTFSDPGFQAEYTGGRKLSINFLVFALPDCRCNLIHHIFPQLSGLPYHDGLNTHTENCNKPLFLKLFLLGILSQKLEKKPTTEY